MNEILWKKTHKYGVDIPRSVEHAYRIDNQNGNSYWRDAIKKGMTNVLTSFEILELGDNSPQYLKELGVPLIFDMNMCLTCNARLLAEGNKTTDPVGSTYAGIVPRETVQISFMND